MILPMSGFAVIALSRQFSFNSPVRRRTRFSQPDVENNNQFCLTGKFQSLKKSPKFDGFAAFFEISPQMARFCVDSGADSRRSPDARSGTARLGPGARAVAGQSGQYSIWPKRCAHW